MHIRISLKYLLILALLLGIRIYAQDYSIKSYSIVDNVKGTYVYSGFQDNKGFIWFATKDGAFKFDGKRFNKFNLELNGNNNNVFQILQDSKGIIWFITLHDVQRFDGKTLAKYDLKNGKKHTFIKKILEDDEGRIWFWGGKELYCLKNFQLTNFIDNLNLENDEFLRDISKGIHGELLFLTTKSIKKLAGNKFEPVNEYHSIARKQLYTVLTTRSGEMWSGDRFGNILIYNGKIRKENIVGDASIESLTEDSQGNIWINTSKGLFKYNGNNIESFNLYKDNLAKLVNYSFEDKEGNIWACAQTGVYKIQRKNFSKINPFHNLAIKQVQGIIEDDQGQMWFCSPNDGLFTYDGKNFRKLVISGGREANRINGLMKGKDGTIWCATDAGLLRIKSGEKKLFTINDGLKNNRIVPPLIEDKNGCIWFRNEFYIARFDGRQFTFPYNSKIHNAIFRMAKGFDDQLWLGNDTWFKTLEGKLILDLRKSSDVLKLRKQLFYLKYDNDRNIWAGIPESGFSIISADGKLKELISQNDGLLDNSIFSMLFDKNGYLWIGTGSGICRFDVNRYKKTGQKIFENFRNAENEVTARTLVLTEDSRGNIWAGTTHGVIRFDAHLLNRGIASIPPQIHLTNLKLFLDKFNYLDYSDSIDLKTGMPAHLKLPYDKNYISFEFIGLNYSSPEDVEYKYRLNGFDSTWSPIVKVNEVTYTNLPPGSYKFEVMARNKDGLWSVRPDSLSFTIAPPFWKTWWFYLICFCIGSTAVFGYIKIKTRNLERQKLELEKTVDIRTKELQEEKAKVEEINRELEKSRYQLSKINELQAKWLDDLSESEKQLMEINTNKDKLFSIISHDLKSPFRSLLMYSETMLGKLDSLTVKEIKGYTEEVHRYSENIYRLLEDLLDWSRIQIGGMVFEPREFNIAHSVTLTMEMLKGNAEKKGIILKNNVPGAAFVYADENMIKSILNNLISNAIKFTDRFGVVEVSALRENGSVQVSVCDNGIGMSEDEMIKLFKIDKHFHKSGTANEKGTGLGLILCKELIEKNGGAISVQSRLGQGTNFIFTVPSSYN